MSGCPMNEGKPVERKTGECPSSQQAPHTSQAQATHGAQTHSPAQNEALPFEKMPGPPTTFLFGNLLELLPTSENAKRTKGFTFALWAEWAQKFGSVFREKIFRDSYVIVCDPAETKKILFTEADKYVKGPKGMIDMFKELAPTNMFSSEGDLWHRHRVAAQPAFAAREFRKLFPTFLNHVTVLINLIHNESKGGKVVLMEEKFKNLTFDVIADAGFGVKMDSLIGKPTTYVTDFNTVAFMINDATLKIWQRFNPFFTRKFRFHSNRLRAGMELIAAGEMTKQREKQPDDPNLPERVSILSLLAKAQHDPALLPHQRLTAAELVDDTLIFMGAGHETTSAGLCWAIFLVSQHPEVQKKVQEEVDRVCGDKPFEYNHLRELTYLDHVWKETLRLYPPAAAIGRQVAANDAVIGGYKIPKDTNIILATSALHLDPSVWTDPHHFRPERFDNAPPIYSYTPFGSGPRVCIGQHFATQEAKLALAAIFRNFQVEYQNPGDELKGVPAPDQRKYPYDGLTNKYSLSMYPRQNVPIKFTLRQSDVKL